MLKKLFKESLIYGLSRYIGKFISIFLLPLYTAVLKPEDYGILDLLGTITFVSTFLIVSGTDSALGYYYYRKEYENERGIIISSSMWIRIFFSFIIFLLILLFSKFLSLLLFGRDYSLFIIITATTLAFSSVFSFLYDLLRFEFRPWLYTIISTSSILIQILLNIYFVLYLKEGVSGALTANLICFALFFTVTLIYVFKKYGFRFSGKWSKNILKYGSPLIGTGIAVWVLTSSDRYFLAHYANLSSVGIYAVGMKLANFLGLISGALQLAWGPFAFGVQYNKNARFIYSQVFWFFFIINIIGIYFISVFALSILKVFTNPDYYTAKAVVPFLCFSTIFWSGYFIVGIGMNITKKLQHTIWITVFAMIINIILNFILTPVWGAIGASFTLMVSNFLILVITYYISQKYYKIPYDIKSILLVLIFSSFLIFLIYYFEVSFSLKLIISFFYLMVILVYIYYYSKNNFPQFEKLKQYFKNSKLEPIFRQWLD